MSMSVTSWKWFEDLPSKKSRSEFRYYWVLSLSAPTLRRLLESHNGAFIANYYALNKKIYHYYLAFTLRTSIIIIRL